MSKRYSQPTTAAQPPAKKQKTGDALPLKSNWWEKEGEEADNDDNEDGKVKWKSLEHHGVTFFPPYQPHGIPIIHKVNLE